jgi:hypothetical protein
MRTGEPDRRCPDRIPSALGWVAAVLMFFSEDHGCHVGELFIGVVPRRLCSLWRRQCMRVSRKGPVTSVCWIWSWALPTATLRRRAYLATVRRQRIGFIQIGSGDLLV